MKINSDHTLPFSRLKQRLFKAYFVTLIISLFLFPLNIFAQEKMPQALESAIYKIQTDWAKANYELEASEQAFEQLERQTKELSEQYPKHAEPLIWQAIVMSSNASKNGGLSALSKVTDARDLLLKAEKINPTTLHGALYTTLGTMYYRVPMWPIGFRDKDLAKQYLLRALEINPNGIDPNFFYGDFLLEQGNSKEAISYFEKALKAPPRTHRPLADKGRKAAINKKLKIAMEN